MFDEQNWDQVLEHGVNFRKRFRYSKHESSVLFLMAEAALNIRDLDTAEEYTDLLSLKFKNSLYSDDVHWIKSEIALMKENWDEAAEHLGWIVGFSDDPVLKEDAQKKLLQLTNFLKRINEPEKTLRTTTSLKPWIALILPFTGAYSKSAEAFRLGFQVTWEAGDFGKLAIFDTAQDPVTAARLVRRLSREDSIWACVGGIDPGEAAALAGVCVADDISFLSTTCNVNGLASIGRQVFQGRPDYHTIGQELARHAISELDLGVFAILAPQNQAGQQIATGFKSEVEYFDREILAEDIYYPGTEDLKSYFKRIRNIGLRRAFDDSLKTQFENFGFILLDSIRLIPPPSALEAQAPILNDGMETRDHSRIVTYEDTTWTLSELYLDSLWVDEHRKHREWIVETSQEIDSLEIPVNVFDGFLFVAEPEMINMFAPQFARANIQTQLLGDENWANYDILSTERAYIDGIVFADPLASVGGEDFYNFFDRLSAKSPEPLNSYHLAGERAACMIGFAAERSRNPEEMRIALSQIRDLETISGRVSLLKEDRVDRHVQLVQYKAGEFIRIGE
ncbi:amino acid ABC transporter substrate-binding protein [bacterium]|nr:amino acid ABC transporter substrate-binding protein [bacterium]